MRSALVPFLAPASEAPTKGDAAIADVEAVRRSRGSASAASESAPGAVPGRHELLSGAMPEDACMAQHVSMPVHLCRALLTAASAHAGVAAIMRGHVAIFMAVAHSTQVQCGCRHFSCQEMLTLHPS